MPMQLRGLRTFCLAVRHLSFKKAADEMCPSASELLMPVIYGFSDRHQGVDLRIESMGESYFVSLGPH